MVSEMASDVEGNTYGIVKVGAQFWMRENLRTTTYNNGVGVGSAYCWYKDSFIDIASSEKLKKQFGALYERAAVMNGKLAPEGWRVAGDEDWITMELFLGMKEHEAYSDSPQRANNIGDFLKSEGREWADGGGGTNLSGLGIMPGGQGFGAAIEICAYMWSVDYNKKSDLMRLINSTYSVVLRRLVGFGSPPFSVRCLRNE